LSASAARLGIDGWSETGDFRTARNLEQLAVVRFRVYIEFVESTPLVSAGIGRVVAMRRRAREAIRGVILSRPSRRFVSATMQIGG
jgi:hypothetical protein